MSENREQANIKALELATKHFFAGKESVVANKQPKIICFFGQPGVGKSSSVKPKVIEELEPSSLIDLEVDELKSFAPILADEVGKITQTDAAKYAPISQWFSGLADRAIKNNNHLCISRQRLLLTPHKTMALMRKAKKAGFNSEFCFTAAHPLKSISGMAKRYEISLEKAIKNQSSADDYPRKPNIMQHNVFLKLNNYMARSAGSLPFLDNVTVYDRNGNTLFDKKQKIGKSAYKEINQEQTRAWSPKEKAELIGDFNFVIEKMKARNANADEIKQIETFKIQAFKHPVYQQSNENIASIIKDSKQR